MPLDGLNVLLKDSGTFGKGMFFLEYNSFAKEKEFYGVIPSQNTLKVLVAKKFNPVSINLEDSIL